MYAAYNLLPPGSGLDYVLTDVLDPSNNSATVGSTDVAWTKVKDFIFADGRTVGPDLLRDEPEQNYLSLSVQAVGLTLFGVVVVLSVLSVVWIVINRDHQVLRAAQPVFLLIICAGALCESFTIMLLSFDEGNGWTDDRLNRLCKAIPWTFLVGYIASYAAIYSKVRTVMPTSPGPYVQNLLMIPRLCP
jgi:hypothetical protein